MSKSITPLYDFLCNFILEDKTRFFMPGHKGNHPNELLNVISRYDITEIAGADSLYEANGILRESEKIASSIYDTSATVFSAGGSTLCIQTMLSLVAKPKDSVIVARNSHIAFFNSCALLDINPIFILPSYNDAFGVSGVVTAGQVEDTIKGNKDAKAVYITSPDYMGVMSDIAEIARVCKAYDIPLVVDNAHGAHLKWLEVDLHPITLGATLCCDSAHKTLPVFTGGAYLHAAKSSYFTAEKIKKNMALFGSTSPSYLIMLSLDLCNNYLLQNAKSDFFELAQREKTIWKALSKKGFIPISKNCEPTKITLDGAHVGKSGEELASHFAGNNIEPEYVGERHLVLMLSPQNTKTDYDRLFRSIEDFSPGATKESKRLQTFLPKRVLSLSKALFCDCEEISVEGALGRISAQTKIKCPPGVPIVVAGEEIDERVQKLLKRSSIFSIDVIQ